MRFGIPKGLQLLGSHAGRSECTPESNGAVIHSCGVEAILYDTASISRGNRCPVAIIVWEISASHSCRSLLQKSQWQGFTTIA